MNKTIIKKKHTTHKNSMQYRKLRRWVLPAILGAALSTLAFIPTFASETQAEVDPSTFTGTSIITENKSIAHELITNTTSDQNAFICKNKAVVTI